MEMKLTVFWNGQFWVGVIEEWNGKRLRASQWIFGGEPKDEEILQLLRGHDFRDRRSPLVRCG
jgi:hypothetical protein